MRPRDVVRAWVDAFKSSERSCAQRLVENANGAAPSIWHRLPIGRRRKGEAAQAEWAVVNHQENKTHRDRGRKDEHYNRHCQSRMDVDRCDRDENHACENDDHGH